MWLNLTVNVKFQRKLEDNYRAPLVNYIGLMITLSEMGPT